MSCGGKQHGGTHLPANPFCCPEQQVFVEDFCGNLVGPIAATTPIWTAPTVNDYFQGTFTVTNNSDAALAIGANGAATTTVPPRSTVSISVNQPTSFNVILGPAQQAGYCIRLYKRV